MRRTNLLWVLLLCLLMASVVFTCRCASSSKNSSDDDTAADDDAADDDAADDDAADDDVADDDAADDDSDDAVSWTGNENVNVDLGAGPVEVPLNGLPAFTWNDPDDGLDKTALLVQTVVDEASKSAPADLKYNFICTDTYNILTQKLDGDYRKLPTYDQLAQGWFIEYDESMSKYTDIKIVWDTALGFPKSFGAKLMDGGTIQGVENVLFGEHATFNVGFATKKAYTAIDLYGMPAFDDAGTPAVYLHLVILEAALAGFDPKNKVYAFNFTSNDTDGNWDLLVQKLGGDTSLLPVWTDTVNNKDMHHGWIENAGATDGVKVIWDAATGFPGYYKVKHMDSGYIDVYDITKNKKK